MWFATLMGSDIIKEADDRKLIKSFVCNPGLRNVMWEDTKGTKDEVEKICGPSGRDAAVRDADAHAAGTVEWMVMEESEEFGNNAMVPSATPNWEKRRLYVGGLLVSLVVPPVGMRLMKRSFKAGGEIKAAGAKMGACLAGRPEIEYFDIVE